MKPLLLTSAFLALTGCSASLPPVNEAPRQAIQQALQPAPAPAAATAAPALPASLSASLLPPLRQSLPNSAAQRLDPRFDLVVAEAPIQQVLSAIVSDTGYSILLRPRSGEAGSPAPLETVTVNLKNVTVLEALNAVRELLGYEYTVDGQRITVQPPELGTRLFQLNYVQGQRRGLSDLRVVSGASGGSGGKGYGSTQASALSTETSADLWAEVEDAMRTVLGCELAAPAAKTEALAPTFNTTERDGKSSRSTSPAAPAPTAATNRGKAGCPGGRALTVNPMSGTILVRAMPGELRMAQQLLRSMQLSVERQVIIEAKIIDVELNASAQQGINWSGFRDGLHRFSVGADPKLIVNAASGGGAIGNVVNNNTQGLGLAPASMDALLGGALTSGASGAFASGLGMALQLNNFSALINFLQTQGQVHVLSSPRIATLNNQKAVLKVGSEESFVTNISGGKETIVDGKTAIEAPSLNYQPFFSGISLDVTPQIDDSGNITLHVHSLISSISEKQKIATPSAGSSLVPFAVNNINETDSVIRTRDNQVVVIGGLMTESMQDSRSRVPGAGEAPLVGGLFRKGGQQSVKRELVILLKPTVVKDDSTWQDDIAASRSRIERMNSAPPVDANRQP